MASISNRVYPYKLSIVIPCFNEGRHLAQFIEQLKITIQELFVCQVIVSDECLFPIFQFYAPIMWLSLRNFPELVIAGCQRGNPRLYALTEFVAMDCHVGQGLLAVTNLGLPQYPKNSSLRAMSEAIHAYMH